MSSHMTSPAASSATEQKAYAPPNAYGYGYGYAAAPAAAAPPPAGAGAAAPPPSPAGADAAPEPALDAAPPAGTMVSYIEDFNSILKKMTCELVVRYPTDATIARAKKRILLAMDMDPVFIIDAVGPYLYTYREGIYAGDARFFIENDYDAELRQSVNAEKADLTSYIIPKVKEAWQASDSDQREAYKVTVQSLFDVYLDYLALKMTPGGQ